MKQSVVPLFLLLLFSTLHMNAEVSSAHAANEAVLADYVGNQNVALGSENPNAVDPPVVWIHGIGREIHVNPWHVDATDEGRGLYGAPYQTLAAAVKEADASKRDNIGTRLILHPGVYTEQLLFPKWSADKDTDAPIIIEGLIDMNGQGVVLSGSDVWADGWHADADTAGLFWHDWTYDWGFGPDPWAHMPMGSQQRMKPLARRYEMIRVDGEIYRQVLDESELSEGRYYIDEEADKLWLYLPEGQTPEAVKPQVAIRWMMLEVIGRRNVTIKGITVEGTATGKGGRRSVALWQNFDITLQDFVVRQNNGAGLSIQRTDHLTMRNVSSLENGLSGGGITRCRNIDIDGLVLSFNNWRGDWAGFRGWDPAGIKMLSIRDAYLRNITVQGNKAHGLWLDYDLRRVVVENLRSWDNLRYGLIFEANPGPVVVRDSVVTGNDIGILLANTIGTTIENTIIVDNYNAQLSFYDNPGRRWIDRFDGREGIVEIANTDLSGNLIASINTRAPLIKTDMRKSIWETLDTQKNLWFSRVPDEVVNVAGLSYAFDSWQLLTGKSLNDHFSDPLLEGDIYSGFEFEAESPLYSRQEWPTVEVPDPGIHAILDRVASRIRASWERSYPNLDEAKPSDFETISLASVANRPLIGENGWIGMELYQIEPGQHRFHGIPFVLPEPNADGNNGLMLRSNKFTHTGDFELPRQVDVPVDLKAETLYVLHVCGYAAAQETIATYTIIYEDGTEHTMDIDVLGGNAGAAGADMIAPLVAVSEIQDWWPFTHQFESAHARSVLIANAENPIKDPRYLYTLEFVNPHPEKMIRAFRAESKEGTDATLMLLGLTAHKH